MTGDGDESPCPLAETLARLEAEVERLERQSAADYIEIDYADAHGGAAITLNYHDLKGEV